jgi:hypothetical protein
MADQRCDLSAWSFRKECSTGGYLCDREQWVREYKKFLTDNKIACGNVGKKNVIRLRHHLLKTLEVNPTCILLKLHFEESSAQYLHEKLGFIWVKNVSSQLCKTMIHGEIL